MNIRMDSEVKKQAEAIFGEIGINMTTAINIFLKQAIRENGIPFELKVKTPNAQTAEAMEESDRIAESKKSRFNNADEMFSDLGI